MNPKLSHSTSILVTIAGSVVLLTVALNPLTASEILSPSDVVNIAAAVQSKMKPKVFDLPNESFPYTISAWDNRDTVAASPENYLVRLSPWPPQIPSEGNMFSDPTTFGALAKTIQAVKPYLAAKINILKFISAEPTIASLRKSIKRGEFETETELQARIPSEHARELQAWRRHSEAMVQKVKECSLSNSAPSQILIPGLTRRVQSTPIVFHCAHSPNLLEAVITNRFANLEPRALPIFNISTLSFDDAELGLDDRSVTGGRPNFQFWGSQRVKIAVPSIEEGKRLKEAFGNGTVFMTAQCVPILQEARTDGPELAIVNVLMYLTDIHFLYATKKTSELSAATVTISVPQTISGDFRWNQQSKQDAEMFLLRLNEWFSSSGKAR